MVNSPSSDLYWAMLLGTLEGNDAPPVLRAYHLAWRAHRGQLRDGGQVPYLTHPLRVALILARELERREPLLLCVALLHDVLEDSTVTPDEIEHVCGAWVAEAVQQLTKPHAPAAGKAARDEAYYGTIARAGQEVRLVKCADRLDNLRSLRELRQPERLSRYLAETGRYLLPIAAVTDRSLHTLLMDQCGEA